MNRKKCKPCGDRGYFTLDMMGTAFINCTKCNGKKEYVTSHAVMYSKERKKKTK